MSKQTEALKLAQKAMGLIDADLVCEAAHHEKKDRHQIGEPCPIQARWHQAFAAIREALAEQPAQPIRWDSNAGDMTGAMATLPKTGSESVVDYKPVISDVGADANIAGIPGTYYGIVLKGTGKITLHEYKPRKPWVGLTKAEVDSLTIYPMNPTADLVKAIEAKLKEKNT